MANVAKIRMLSPEKFSRVREVIRAHQYCQLDTMVEVLRASEIEVSRSALHRYTRKLVQLDGATCQDENITVVVIMNRATGATDTLLTPASAAKIRAAISFVSAPAP